MIERVTFTPEADEDVAAASQWYESREPGLSEDSLVPKLYLGTHLLGKLCFP